MLITRQTLVTGTLWWLLLLLVIGVTLYALAFASFDNIGAPPLKERLFSAPIAAYCHFIGGAIALLAGVFQINPSLRNQHLLVHRTLGRIYCIAVLISGIAGLFMATQSMGGLPARTGFFLLALFWLISTWQAYKNIRQGKILLHKQWMIRSYALCLAAVTLRIYIPSLIMGLGYSFDEAYPTVAWLCWVPNLVIAEVIILSSYHKSARSS